jgi:hypothetical protein
MHLRNNEMMRLATPFPNLNNMMSGDIPHDIMWLLIGQGFDYLRRHRKTLFNPKNIRKNFGWFQIVCLAVCLISSINLGLLFGKLHLKKLVTYTEKNNMSFMKIGFQIFKKIEPQLASFIFERFEKLVQAKQIGNITGVYNYDEVFKI